MCARVRKKPIAEERSSRLVFASREVEGEEALERLVVLTSQVPDGEWVTDEDLGQTFVGKALEHAFDALVVHGRSLGWGMDWCMREKHIKMKPSSSPRG